MQLTVENINKILGTKYEETEARIISDIFIPSVQKEIENICNQDFLQETQEGLVIKDYPLDLLMVACKRVVFLFQNRNKSENKIKSESIGNMKVEFFETNDDRDNYEATLNRYRVPNL